MNVVILNESAAENRVALTPSKVKHYKDLHCAVFITKNAGKNAGYQDKAYEDAGAIIEKTSDALLKADIILSINPPKASTLKKVKKDVILISQLQNEDNKLLQYCIEKQITLLNLNAIPRISRAQNMDVLSSQANLSGYKAVLLAINHFQRVVPMMMTAAGMIHPAKVLILGAGVAGLQAIATAKRIGAEVFAFDVRQAAREQVESLGATFVSVSEEEDLESEGGYASQTSDDYKKKQAALIQQYASQSDIVISTALIPNRPAPILLSKETVSQMKPGSVIVDIATSRGGNCELSVKDKIIVDHGITIVGYSNLAGMLSKTASELFSNNVLNVVKLLINKKTSSIELNPEDTIIQHSIVCHNGQSMPFLTKE